MTKIDEFIEWLNNTQLKPEEAAKLPLLLLPVSTHELMHKDLFSPAPAGNPESKTKEEDDDLIGKVEAAKMLAVDPHWFSGRKLPFKRRLGHRTVKFSRRGLIKWREAQVKIR